MAKKLSQWLDGFSINDPVNDLSPQQKFNNVKAAVKQLNLAENFSCPLITVVGTNGKGSCVAALSAIYLQANYRVAAMTSPHIYQVNERIVINGKMVDDQTICHAFEMIATHCQDIELTFFQIIALAAFIIFQQQQLDLIILEAGLGARYDAVNIFDANVVVISSIALDHCQQLGCNREVIAEQKIAVARRGQAIVCGDRQAPGVIGKTAVDLHCRYYQLGNNFDYWQYAASWSWHSQQSAYQDLAQPVIMLDNAATALMAVELLQSELSLENQHIVQGLSAINLLGRCQLINKKPLHLYDVAHNAAAVNVLADKIRTLKFSGRCHALFAVMKDKDVREMVMEMLPLVDQWYLADMKHEKAMPSDELAKLLVALNQRPIEHELAGQQSDVWSAQGQQNYIQCFNSTTEAYRQLMSVCQSDDLVVIFGSFYMISDILPLE